MRAVPSEGDVYIHQSSGEYYTVILVANMDATRPGWDPTVVYEDSEDRVWARPLAVFTQKFQQVSPGEVNP